MKKKLPHILGAVVTLISASCAYDPYYSPSSVSGSYSTGYGQGYGQGYGHGGSSFSSSVFIGTGNPRWGYDPYCYSYYDYTRRSYYDPYLNGYYPVGYRPPVVYGVPHPHGWRPGRTYCPPPSRVSSVTISNYRDRESSYRRSDYGWANQVRQQSVNTGRPQSREPIQENTNRQNPFSRPPTRENPFNNSRPQTEQRNFTSPDPRQESRGSSRPRIDAPPQQPEARFRQSENSRRQEAPSRPAEIRPIAPPDEVRTPPEPAATPEPRQEQRSGFRGQSGNPFSDGNRRSQRGGD